MLPLLPTMGCSSSLAMSRRGEDVTEMAEWEEEVRLYVPEPCIQLYHGATGEQVT